VIIPANYAQANVHFTGGGAPTGAEVTLGLNVELFVDTPAALAALVLNLFQSAAIRQRMSGDIVIASCSVKYGPNATGPSAEVANPQPGTNQGPVVSPNTTFLIRKLTGFGGRTGRGRMYLPGPAEGQVDAGGLLDAGVRGGLDAAMEDLRNGLVQAGAVPTLLHGAGSPIQVPMPITSFNVDARVATQRRRLRR